MSRFRGKSVKMIKDADSIFRILFIKPRRYKEKVQGSIQKLVKRRKRQE